MSSSTSPRPSNLLIRTPFSQLHLENHMQELAKIGYDKYQTDAIGNIAAASKDRSLRSKDRDDFYKNLASDKYKLGLGDGEMDNKRSAYNQADIEA